MIAFLNKEQKRLTDWLNHNYLALNRFFPYRVKVVYGFKKKKSTLIWERHNASLKTQVMPRDPRLLVIHCSHSAVFLFSNLLHMWQLSKVDHRPSGIFRGVTCENSALLGVHCYCLCYKGTIECRTYELFWIIHFFACIFKKFYKLCILYYIIT